MSVSWRLEPADGGSTTITIDGGDFTVGRRHLGSEFLFVSRAQAALRLPEDGTSTSVILESVNAKNATGVKRDNDE